MNEFVLEVVGVLVAVFAVCPLVMRIVEKLISKLSSDKAKNNNPYGNDSYVLDAGDRVRMELRAGEGIPWCKGKEAGDRCRVQYRIMGTPEYAAASPEEKEEILESKLHEYWRNPETPPPFTKWIETVSAPSKAHREYLIELAKQAGVTTEIP